MGDLIRFDYEGKRIGGKRDILRQIASGLQYVQTILRVIHRDLNPKNILFIGPIDKPVMKLADFGLCRIVLGDETHQTLTLTHRGQSEEVRRAGTWDWMAPEMHNAMHFTYQSDIFPLGLVFGFTLTKGQHPFDDCHPQESNESNETILNKRINCIRRKNEQEMSVKVKQFTRQFIDPRVYKLIESLLNKEPKKRPTVTQVLGDPFFLDDNVPLSFSQSNLKSAQEVSEIID